MFAAQLYRCGYKLGSALSEHIIWDKNDKNKFQPPSFSSCAIILSSGLFSGRHIAILRKSAPSVFFSSSVRISRGSRTTCPVLVTPLIDRPSGLRLSVVAFGRSPLLTGMTGRSSR
jgi:hypothetical protein